MTPLTAGNKSGGYPRVAMFANALRPRPVHNGSPCPASRTAPRIAQKSMVMSCVGTLIDRAKSVRHRSRSARSLAQSLRRPVPKRRPNSPP